MHKASYAESQYVHIHRRENLVCHTLDIAGLRARVVA